MVVILTACLYGSYGDTNEACMGDKLSNALCIERKAAHAFLAEYDRNAVLIAGGKRVAVRKLGMDTGGYSRANLFSLRPGVFALIEMMGSYEIDPEKRTISELNFYVNPTREFVGAFDVDRSHIEGSTRGEWRFIPATERLEQPIGEL